VIFNHLSRIDHMYVNEICYPKKVNMVAGYVEFFRSHLHFAFHMNNVLPKKQYISDIAGTKAIMSIIKKGGSVSFAPEGLASNDGMNKPIVPQTGSLLKKLGVPVYFVQLRGQYLQNNKTCLDERYGETYAKISLFLTPDDLKTLTTEQIDTKINQAFRHDEYAWQKEKRIKWETHGRICHRLEDILYRCPRCGAEFETEGVGDKITCHRCGNGATMDDYYEFHPFDESCVIPESPSAWVNDERVQVIREIRADENYVFTEKISLGKIPDGRWLKHKKTSEIVANGTMTIDHNGVHFRGEDTNLHDFDVPYTEIYSTVTEVDASNFSFYYRGEYHEIHPERHSFMKAHLLIEEMHRLHVNVYKNFPWNDYMYEPQEKKEN